MIGKKEFSFLNGLMAIFSIVKKKKKINWQKCIQNMNGSWFHPLKEFSPSTKNYSMCSNPLYKLSLKSGFLE